MHLAHVAIFFSGIDLSSAQNFYDHNYASCWYEVDGKKGKTFLNAAEVVAWRSAIAATEYKWTAPEYRCTAPDNFVNEGLYFHGVVAHDIQSNLWTISGTLVFLCDAGYVGHPRPGLPSGSHVFCAIK